MKENDETHVRSFPYFVNKKIIEERKALIGRREKEVLSLVSGRIKPYNITFGIY